LDGIDIWPILTGEEKSINREVLLYFDNWDLQCARWDNWKLHVARHNSSTYSAPPAGGRHNYVLPRPELYNLAADPQESYDVAPTHPEIVAEIRRHIEKLLAGFPEPVQRAYAESKARKVDPLTPTGARPRPLTN
jgi:arylsulfatase